MAYQREVLVGLLVALACLLANGCGVVEPQHPGKLEGWSYAISGLAIMDNRTPNVEPDEEDSKGECSTCNGTGRVGDGRVFVECLDCGGDGVIDDDDINADRQAVTPAPDITQPQRSTVTICGPSGCYEVGSEGSTTPASQPYRAGPLRRLLRRWR